MCAPFKRTQNHFCRRRNGIPYQNESHLYKKDVFRKHTLANFHTYRVYLEIHNSAPSKQGLGSFVFLQTHDSHDCSLDMCRNTLSEGERLRAFKCKPVFVQMLLACILHHFGLQLKLCSVSPVTFLSCVGSCLVIRALHRTCLFERFVSKSFRQAYILPRCGQHMSAPH